MGVFGERSRDKRRSIGHTRLVPSRHKEKDNVVQQQHVGKTGRRKERDAEKMKIRRTRLKQLGGKMLDLVIAYVLKDEGLNVFNRNLITE